MAIQSVASADQAIVLYDGACRFCQFSVRVLTRLDWRHRLHFQSARGKELPASDIPLIRGRVLEAMHLLTPDRKRVHAGFGAFRWIAWRLPLTVPLAPLLYVPGIPWLGSKVYHWVAKNRFGLVPCRNGTCRVPGDHTRQKAPGS
jgi:predicted DCC family thiol-disulfide oxidoreductase YuxK